MSELVSYSISGIKSKAFYI